MWSVICIIMCTNYQERHVEVGTFRNSSPAFRISNMVLPSKFTVKLGPGKGDKDDMLAGILLNFALNCQIWCLIMCEPNWALLLFIQGCEKPGDKASASHCLSKRVVNCLYIVNHLLLFIVQLFPIINLLVLRVSKILVVQVFSCVFIWYFWIQAVRLGVKGTTDTLMMKMILLWIMAFRYD